MLTSTEEIYRKSYELTLDSNNDLPVQDYTAIQRAIMEGYHLVKIDGGTKSIHMLFEKSKYESMK